MAVVDAMKITEGYMQPQIGQNQLQDQSPNDHDHMQVDTHLPTDHTTASDSIDPEEKLQGCTMPEDTTKTAEKSAESQVPMPSSTARLGAGQL